MNTPHIAAKSPVKVSLKAGKTYYFCTCGHSSGQPFCDGSHKGTTFQPQALHVEKDQDAWLCQCKHSNNLPYCDGAHSKLPEEDGV
ncbi:MAG: CDGSH iron-sulfur domain-containing protein [Verrucomicrobiota bacterium]